MATGLSLRYLSTASISRCAISPLLRTGTYYILPLHGERRRIALRVCASQERDKPDEAAAASRKRSLEQLDQQLKIFSDSEDSASCNQGLQKLVLPDNKTDEKEVIDESRSPLEWPEFTPNFLAYVGVALLLLTIVNNVLFRIFLGPTSVARDKSFQSSSVPEPRYRITTLQEEKEAREAKESQQKLLDQAKEAPFN